jgi:hypothetical protein
MIPIYKTPSSLGEKIHRQAEGAFWPAGERSSF